eukprot:m.259696 g.259696  ORF g.259696 m.259696 type:complete len:52 (-) comp38518_c0_seq1:166-321(-)
MHRVCYLTHYCDHRRRDSIKGTPCSLADTTIDSTTLTSATHNMTTDDDYWW